jgi:hypothetical protein
MSQSQVSTKVEDDEEFDALMDILMPPLPLASGYRPKTIPKELREELNRFRNCPYNINIISEENTYSGEDPNVLLSISIEAGGIEIPFDISVNDIEYEKNDITSYGRKAVISFVRRIVKGKVSRLNINNEYTDISTLGFDEVRKTIDIQGTFPEGLRTVVRLQLSEKLLRFLYDLSSRAYNQNSYDIDSEEVL